MPWAEEMAAWTAVNLVVRWVVRLADDSAVKMAGRSAASRVDLTVGPMAVLKVDYSAVQKAACLAELTAASLVESLVVRWVGH